jgi:hypothetical protein
VTAAAFIALSFLLFAADQSREGSETQQRAVDGDGVVVSDTDVDRLDPPAFTERVREQRHSGAREAIDDVNDVLLRPFADIVDSDNIWADRAVPAVLGLLLYGLLGMMLANFIPKHRRQTRDWREVPG